MKILSPHSLGTLAWHTISILFKTMSIEQRFANCEYAPGGSKPAIYISWHGRLLIPFYMYRNSKVTIIVSGHRDGEILTSSLKTAGFNTVRGSTTRGGARALVQLVKLARKGAKIGFTPDGPKGPRWNLQPGSIYLAAKTELPVVPISGSVNHAYYFKSWDSFQLPLPFSKVVINVGEPYFVKGGLDPDNIEYHRAELERRLIALTLEADEIIGVQAGR